MKESNFVSIFKEAARKTSKNLIVKQGSNLFYELSLNRNLELSVSDLSKPKRGQSAFQTDICIYEHINNIDFPRIVIEFKTNISTHDILTYSTKAGKHKKIYPCLRYGLLASEIDFIPDRFFMHNENIDFFIAAAKYKDHPKFQHLVDDLIKKEIEISKIIEEIHFGDIKYDYYRTDIVFQNFSEKSSG